MFYLETRNMARMTYLAPIYVPLSYCSTIFGMEGNVRPGASGFGSMFLPSSCCFSLWRWSLFGHED